MKTDRLIRRHIPIEEMNTVTQRQKEVRGDRDIQLLERCNNLWQGLSEFRRKRARASRFAFDDQWGDTINIDGKVISQREYLEKQGNVVMQTNQIISKIRTLTGVLVKEENEPICLARDRNEQQYGEIITTALHANCEANKMQDLYITLMKELCIGGLLIAHESYCNTVDPSGRLDSWTRYCNPNQVFFDSAMTDPRGWDMTIIGQFFDLSFEEVASMFVKNEKDYTILKDIYYAESLTFRNGYSYDVTDKNNEDNIVFDSSYDPEKCRVFEVWTKETKARIRLHDTNEGTEEIIDADDYAYRQTVRQENLKRKKLALESGWKENEIPYIVGDGYGATAEEKSGFFIDTFWYCRFLAPDGTILWEGESLYPDKSHPFAIAAIPLIDGKITGYITDAIDHNIAINRALILHDWLIRRQAKGITVVPKQLVPDDVSFDEFAHSWTSVDDMIFIDVKPGHEGLMPKTFYGSAQTYNVSELISTLSGLMENSLNINDAIQGKTPFAGASGSLYAQMTQNASTPIASLLATFHSFIKDIHTKKMKNIAHFYDENRLQQIVGNIESLREAELNLNDIADMEFDLKVRENPETPIYRAIANEDIKQFLMNGLIPLKDYLKLSSMPYADKLLQLLESQEAQQAEAQQVQGVNPMQMNPNDPANMNMPQ